MYYSKPCVTADSQISDAQSNRSSNIKVESHELSEAMSVTKRKKMPHTQQQQTTTEDTHDLKKKSEANSWLLAE
jgi:hypothetical protein